MKKVIAHRGFSSKFPENSMLAFERAAAVGADGIALDVQLSADGIPVIFHDESLARITGDNLLVQDLTLRELKTLNISDRFSGQCPVQRIPTLEEYFAFAQTRNLLSIVALKNVIFEYPGIEGKVVALIDAYRLNGKVIVSSFNHDSLLRCKALAPDLPYGVLYDCRIAEPQRYAASLGMQYLHPNYRFLNDAELEKYEAAGVKTNPWTVDEPEAMRDLLSKRNVFAIITSKPDLLMALRSGK